MKPVFLKCEDSVFYLAWGKKEEAEFVLSEGDEAVAAYAYCNLHGFWKAEI